MSIRVVAKHNVKPEKLEEGIKLCKQLVEATNKNDWGCIHYQLYQDTENPTVIAMLEEWESAEAITDHLNAAHFHEILPAIRECMAGPPELNSFNLL